MTQRQSGIILLSILFAVTVFHLLILTQVIPYTVVWAGKLESLDEMYVFETVSIVINMVLIVAVLKKIKCINTHIPDRVVAAVLWLFVVIFTLNTIGNLFAVNRYEQFLGTSTTLICAVLCWKLVRKNVQPD